MNTAQISSATSIPALTNVIKTDVNSVFHSAHVNLLFLTPEQDQARRHFRKGLLVGVAGTGKTIILRAIADELLQDEGSRVVFVAPSPHNTRMRKHFEGCLTSIFFDHI